MSGSCFHTSGFAGGLLTLIQDLRQYYHFLSEEVNREELNKVVNGLLESCEEFDVFPLSLEGIDSLITDSTCFIIKSRLLLL